MSMYIVAHLFSDTNLIALSQIKEISAHSYKTKKWIDYTSIILSVL